MTAKPQTQEQIPPAPEVDEPPAPESRLPRVGDVVFYWPQPYETLGLDGPQAAIICRVLIGDPMYDGLLTPVSLHIFNPKAVAVGHDPVQRKEGVQFTDSAEAGRWSWRDA